MTTRLLPLGDADPPAGEAPRAAVACQALVIGDTRYHHSAAQFWPQLIDELRDAFPAGTQLELSVVTAEPFTPARLDPLAELQRDLESLAASDMESVMRESVAQLALLGPPGLVRVRLLEGETARLEGELPADAVDAEGFMYLAAWLLEWARLPHERWDAEQLDGLFVGHDRERRCDYHLRFITRREPLREGLHRLTLRLDPRVERH